MAETQKSIYSGVFSFSDKDIPLIYISGRKDLKIQLIKI